MAQYFFLRFDWTVLIVCCHKNNATPPGCRRLPQTRVPLKSLILSPDLVFLAVRGQEKGGGKRGREMSKWDLAKYNCVTRQLGMLQV